MSDFFMWGNDRIETEGELNYLFTMVAKKYLEDHGLSYSTLNDINGAFDGASKEFYRRVCAPYEDDKRREHGDVY